MVGNEHKPRGCNLKLKTDQSILALGNEGLSARHFALRFRQFPFGLQRLDEGDGCDEFVVGLRFCVADFPVSTHWKTLVC